MKSRFLAFAALAALLFISPVQAADSVVHAGDIAISGQWARATIGNLKNTAAYFKMTNKGAAADHLLSVSSSAAKMVHLHKSVEEGGIAKMLPVKSIAIPAGGSAELAPGGYHVMVMGLSKSLKPGDMLPVTLTFEKAGKVTLELPVMKGNGPAMNMDHGSMGGMGKK